MTLKHSVRNIMDRITVLKSIEAKLRQRELEPLDEQTKELYLVQVKIMESLRQELKQDAAALAHDLTASKYCLLRKILEVL